jgi:asparagine synthase (glutamine-hydrolysing)
MCGIAGIVARSGDAHTVSRHAKEKALALLSHRGPDSSGQYDAEAVWLGHTRLSIIDLSDSGKQPMQSADSRWVIAYNGEAYNFLDLARELGLEDLRSHSDTEIVLRAFSKLEVSVLDRLNGMFALAVYDCATKRIWLARDRMGIKHLYYRLDENGLSFASELGALLALSPKPLNCDLAALHEWSYFGAPLGANSMYRGVKRLTPGQVLELDITTWRVSLKNYWSASQVRPQSSHPSIDELVEQTREHIGEAVQRHLIADVPIGVLLSGGIDSSVIAAMATKYSSKRVSTFAAGFDFAGGTNELPKARRMASYLGTDHHELHIAGADISDVVKQMIDHHGMPFADAANIPLFLLARELSGAARVVLQGDGGDEMFGGYRRHFTLSHFGLSKFAARAVRLISGWTADGVGRARRERYADALLERDPALVMARLLTADSRAVPMTDVFAEPLRDAIVNHDAFLRYREIQKLCDDRPLVDQMLLLDALIVLPDIYFEKVDRATMAASVEARVPFLDNSIVEFCLSLPAHVKIPDGKQKWLLKRAMRGVLPDDILEQPKSGFGVPFGPWLLGPLRQLFHDEIASFTRKHPGVFNRQQLDKWYREYETGKRDHSFLLWKAMNLAIWGTRVPVAF